MGMAAIGRRMTLSTIRVMMGTARCFMVLFGRGRATGSINNGMQPPRTDGKDKLPEDEQPYEFLSAMREHALWAMEDGNQNPEPDQCPLL